MGAGLKGWYCVVLFLLIFCFLFGRLALVVHWFFASALWPLSPCSFGPLALYTLAPVVTSFFTHFGHLDPWPSGPLGPVIAQPFGPLTLCYLGPDLAVAPCGFGRAGVSVGLFGVRVEALLS